VKPHHHPSLTSAEIAGLWSMYIQGTMNVCILSYLLKDTADESIRSLLTQTVQETKDDVRAMRSIFEAEQFPVPVGFSDKDVNLSAPALYTDQYALSFLYGMSRLLLMGCSTNVSVSARSDIRNLFSRCSQNALALYNNSIELMLEKGLYDRPPRIPYPEQVEIVEKQSFMNGIFNKRPLNALELSQMFANIERNYFGILLLQGLIQTEKDSEIRSFLQRGKRMSEEQVHTLNEMLRSEDLLGTVPVQMEVTASQTAPFSDRLVMYLVGGLTSAGIAYMGQSISMSMRRDLGAFYAHMLAEMIHYANDGANLMIERGWMEQPPQAADRKALVTS
jgi:hypothetical protein